MDYKGPGGTDSKRVGTGVGGFPFDPVAAPMGVELAHGGLFGLFGRGRSGCGDGVGGGEVKVSGLQDKTGTFL